VRPSKGSSQFSLVEGDADRDLATFAEAVRSGLTARVKSLPCRFFYDEIGSKLFEEICELPEYYPTRTELEILESCAEELSSLFERPLVLAELGSGSSAKTRVLIDALLRRHGQLRYLPVDVSRSILEESSLTLLDQYDALTIHAIASDYHEGLRHVRAESGRTKLIAWLGSSVGNLRRDDAARFLGTVRQAMTGPDRLLLGIDLRKSRETLERAYDDADGVTARFNLNLLRRINRELGGHFDLDAFHHRARYEESAGFVEIHLVSTRDQRVPIDDLDLVVPFAAGETIHTENSFKFSLDEIDSLAAGAGMRVDRRWLDRQHLFSLNLFAPLT
jgi:dimethylhistidine N-methyltransferase